MIKLMDILYEAKQVGTLYHFTNEKGLMGILNTNSLVSAKKYADHISATRDKNGWYTVGYIPNAWFRISLDGDKLSNKYVIKPFSIITQKGLGRGIGHTESEEAIMASSIPNIRNYILDISVNSSIFDEHPLDQPNLDKIKQLWPDLKIIKAGRSSEWGDALPSDSPLWNN